MKNENAIQVTKERRDLIISEIKNYFLKERDEEMGDLAAGLVLDFIMEKTAPDTTRGSLMLIPICRMRQKIFYRSRSNAAGFSLAAAPCKFYWESLPRSPAVGGISCTRVFKNPAITSPGF